MTDGEKFKVDISDEEDMQNIKHPSKIEGVGRQRQVTDVREAIRDVSGRLLDAIVRLPSHSIDGAIEELRKELVRA